jgi:hypothetical protein
LIPAEKPKPGEPIVTMHTSPPQTTATAQPVPPRPRRRWLWAIGATSALLLCGGLTVIGVFWVGWKPLSETKALEGLPGSETTSKSLIEADLSGLGLTKGQIRDARDDPEWAAAEWVYLEGAAIEYQINGSLAVSIWALKYQDADTALIDYSAASEAASRTCGAYFILGGVIKCTYGDADERIYWHDIWIIEIVAWKGVSPEPEKLLDAVREALVAHWALLAQRQSTEVTYGARD